MRKQYRGSFQFLERVSFLSKPASHFFALQDNKRTQRRKFDAWFTHPKNNAQTPGAALFKELSFRAVLRMPFRKS